MRLQLPPGGQVSKQASLTDIAFDTGVIYERTRILALLKNIEGIEWVLELIEGKPHE